MKKLIVFFVIQFIALNCVSKTDSNKKQEQAAAGLLAASQNVTTTKTTDSTPNNAGDVTNIQSSNVIGVVVQLAKGASVSESIQEDRSIEVEQTSEKINIDHLVISVRDGKNTELGSITIPASSISANAVHAIKLIGGTVYDARNLLLTLKHKTGSGEVFTETKSVEVKVEPGTLHKVTIKVGKYDGVLDISTVLNTAGLNRIEDWRGSATSFSFSKEYLYSNMVRESKGITIPSFTVGTSYYWSNYVLPLAKGITGKNVTIDIQTELPKAAGFGIAAYDTVLSIKGSQNSASIGLIGESWAKSYTSINLGNLSHTNKSELVRDLNSLHTVGFRLVNGTLNALYDGTTIYTLTKPGTELGELIEIGLTHKGSGYMKSAKLTVDGKLILHHNW